VWLARDRKLNRQVALKVLPPDLTQDSSRMARFQQEARAASALNHPNVCTIHALGETADGQQFIAMEFVEGETLRQRLVGRAVTLREALDLAVQVASALSAAHAAGVVHRDVKPENVMLRRDGLVKVLDFGLAKLAPLGSERTDAHTTHAVVRTDAGTVVGTVDYMSPEQARGQPVDARTDVWSLGVLLYELVTGRRPFAGQSSSEVLARILEHEPAPLARFEPDAPPELQRIVAKALRKDREQRYQVMKDLLLDLQALRDGLAGAPTPSTAPASAGSTPPLSSAEYVVTGLARHKFAAALAASLLVLIAVGWWWAVRDRPVSHAVVPSTAPVQRTLTRLTFGPGLQTDVTWSPDGRFIAYASDRKGNFDIWVQPAAGGDPVQVTRSPAQDTQPDWSPDGSDLVFRSERDGGGLFLVPALGGVERQLTSFGSHPSWSPNAPEILFVDKNLGDGEVQARLYAVSLEEGAPREILADFLQGGRWSWIARHPDGRISALGAHRQLGRGFFTIARDGTRLVHSKESPDFPLRVHAGAWSWARRRFRWDTSGSALYVQAESNGVYNLWKVRVDPGTLLWVSAERLTTGPGPDVAAAVSRDGTRLAFSTEHGSTRLWVFPLDPVARRLGFGKPLTEDDAIASSSALSPDGQFVAYNLKRPGIDREELWITNIVDGTSELVATGAVFPCWSPDGKTIAYNYFRTDKPPATGRVAVRQLGGKERFLSRWSTEWFMPSDWRAELGLLGTYENVASRESPLVVWPMTNPDADKPERVLISKAKTGLWRGKFSPNGQWLSFVVLRNDSPGPPEIVVASADGSRPERWTRIAAEHTLPERPRWAPDGRTLYFISQRPTSYFNLWAVRFDPERGTPIDEPYALTQFDSPSLVISPDMPRSEMDVSSRHAVLTMKTVSGSIWMLDNVDR